MRLKDNNSKLCNSQKNKTLIKKNNIDILGFDCELGK